jgi:hypothetical protein
MALVVPDEQAMDEVWARMQKERLPFERVVVNTVRELAKLNPQSHVHASELYAAVTQCADVRLARCLLCWLLVPGLSMSVTCISALMTRKGPEW